MALLDWVALGGYFVVMLLIGLWSHRRSATSATTSPVAAGCRGGSPASPTTCPATARRCSWPTRPSPTATASRSTSGRSCRSRWAPVWAPWVRAAVEPAAAALRGRLAAGVPRHALQRAHPAGARLERRPAEGVRRGREVGVGGRPAECVRRHVRCDRHPGHRRRHPPLLHGRRALGGRAHRLRPVRHPGRRGARHVCGGARPARCGLSGSGTLWHKLPEGHGDPLVGPYTAAFLGAYVVVKLFEYNGGMWNLAQRYMATDTPPAARRSAALSSVLYVVWPAVLLFPPVAAAVLLPNVADPQKVYALMAESYLPAGLVGLTLAGMFSHTMAMASSDANAVSAVVVRDIMPAVVRRAGTCPTATGLLVARVCTVVFIARQHARRHRGRPLRRRPRHHRRSGRRRDGPDLHPDAAGAAARLPHVRSARRARLVGGSGCSATSW